MKKMVCVIMAIVAMVMGTVSAFAVELNRPNYVDTIAYLNEWLTAYGLENYESDFMDSDGYVCYASVMCARTFEEYYKMECTVDNWKTAVEDEFEITKNDVKQVGEIEGHPVYYLVAEGNGQLAYYNYEPHHKVKVYFMISE